MQWGSVACVSWGVAFEFNRKFNLLNKSYHFPPILFPFYFCVCICIFFLYVLVLFLRIIFFGVVLYVCFNIFLVCLYVVQKQELKNVRVVSFEMKSHFTLMSIFYLHLNLYCNFYQCAFCIMYLSEKWGLDI
jgi:hypothetical protein